MDRVAGGAPGSRAGGARRVPARVGAGDPVPAVPPVDRARTVADARARSRRACASSGDFPFGVAADSADVWANQDLFSFDGTVGAPPDAFSEDGQNWQLPVYRWDVMRERGLRVVRRARPPGGGSLRLLPRRSRRRPVPLVGLPARRPGAALRCRRTRRRRSRRARPCCGPSMSGRRRRHRRGSRHHPGLRAERRLRALGVPGYRVLRWEREWDEPGQPFIDPADVPAALGGDIRHARHRDARGVVAGRRRGRAAAALAVAATAWRGRSRRRPAPATRFAPAVRDALLDALYASGSDLLTLPIQDVFGWTDRINVPGAHRRHATGPGGCRGPSTGSTRSPRPPNASRPSAAGPSGMPACSAARGPCYDQGSPGSEGPCP